MAPSLCSSRRASPRCLALVLLASLAVSSTSSSSSSSSSSPPRQSRETLVLQTAHGTLELKLWPAVAPRTAAHVLRLFELGLYTTDHFFRVDAGFVAQLADAGSGGRFPLDARQRAAAALRVPLEAGKGGDWPRHDRAGLLSMARHADPGSGGSSFSVMLGPAPHLDGEYTLFGEVADLRAFEAFRERVEALPTRRDGIFVMPVQRVEVLSSYAFSPPLPPSSPGSSAAASSLSSSTSSSSSSSSSTTSSSSSLSAVEECLRDLKLMEARWRAEKARRVASLPK